MAAIQLTLLKGSEKNVEQDCECCLQSLEESLPILVSHVSYLSVSSPLLLKASTVSHSETSRDRGLLSATLGEFMMTAVCADFDDV